MRRRPNPRFLLLALALLLGQWLALAHGFEHSALQADPYCQICAHAQGLDGGALAPTLKLPTQQAVLETPPSFLVAPPSLAPRGAHPIRGPPSPAIRIA